MKRVKYFVVLYQGRWYVMVNGVRHGPYPTQAEAIRVAREAALASWRRRCPSQVIIQGRDNKFRTEWTYGPDPYPPLG